jgi:hypothetical protein
MKKIYHLINQFEDYMEEFKWGRIMTSSQFGLMISWGKAIIPNRYYISFDIPFLIIQIYFGKIKK